MSTVEGANVHRSCGGWDPPKWWLERRGLGFRGTLKSYGPFRVLLAEYP